MADTRWKKNPFLSMWLSIANRVAGTMCAQATAEAKAAPAAMPKPTRKR